MSTAYQMGVRSVASRLGVKVAASRIDKEIAKGNLSYGDVMPEYPKGPVPKVLDPALKRKMRDGMAAPAARAPEEVARTRALNDAVHRNALAYSAAQPISGLPDAPVRITGNLPPQGPSFNPVTGVAAPDSSGQFLRGMTGGVRSQLQTAKAWQDPSKLPARVPMDSTLNRAVLEHELGEAAEFRSTQRPLSATNRGINPFATHLGSEPILRENLALRGDPEAVGQMAKVRQLHPDDAYVQKLVRQMGGTPDAPLPLEGRQARALEDRLARSAPQLAQPTRAQAVVRDLALDGRVRYVPQEVREHVRGVPRHVEALEQAVNKQDLRGGWQGAKKLHGAATRALQFVQKGL